MLYTLSFLWAVAVALQVLVAVVPEVGEIPLEDVHCPFRKQPPARNTSLIQTILDCNIEYVAIYVPLDTEGWAEMAITASVTDEGMLNDPTPRIGFHKKNKL